MLTKQSTILTELQPHQQRALKRGLLNDLILAHSTGSGKTLTSIAIADALNKPTVVFTPASLVENFKKELAKHKKGGPPVDVISLPTAVSKNYKVKPGSTVILDEAHSIRNPDTSKSAYVKQQLANAGRVIGLTGTPAYNQIYDWSQLVNTVSRKNIMPTDAKAFKDSFINETKVDPGWFARNILGVTPGVKYSIKNASKFRSKVKPYVDMFDAAVDKPERIDQTLHVTMTPEQVDAYNYVTKNIPSNLMYKIVHDIPASKAESANLNSFLSGARQVSNTPEEFLNNSKPGSKIDLAVQELLKTKAADDNFKAFIYSNYLNSGLNSYARLLDKAKLKYNIFNGSLTAAQKKAIVDEYNSGEVPIILGSGSASEGLDLKGTKLIQILEPHFNNSKIEQVIGRGIRYKSHDALPPNERKVLVQRFISDLPQERHFWFSPKKKTSVDEYLTARASEKDALEAQLKDILN